VFVEGLSFWTLQIEEHLVVVHGAARITGPGEDGDEEPTWGIAVDRAQDNPEEDMEMPVLREEAPVEPFYEEAATTTTYATADDVSLMKNS